MAWFFSVPPDYILKHYQSESVCEIKTAKCQILLGSTTTEKLTLNPEESPRVLRPSDYSKLSMEPRGFKNNRRAANHSRKRRNKQAYREARRLLDVAYHEFLASINKPRSSATPSSPGREDPVLNHPQPIENPSSRPQIGPSRSTPPSSTPPPSPSFTRILPDSPLESLFPKPSYSPVSFSEEPPRPPSPAYSTTSSVEFLEKVSCSPSSVPYHHWGDIPFAKFTDFSSFKDPIPTRAYTIGPNNFNINEFHSAINDAKSTEHILVYLPSELSVPYLVTVPFFYNYLPLSTVTIRELG